MKLEEDRRERRRKLGLPEELTEEEKAKEQAKKQAKMQEEAERLRKHVAYAKPVGITEKLRSSLVIMKQTSGTHTQLPYVLLVMSSAQKTHRSRQSATFC